jgi:hypothetical protein
MKEERQKEKEEKDKKVYRSWVIKRDPEKSESAPTSCGMLGKQRVPPQQY